MSHALLTDSYQLAMMQAYLEGGMTEPAAFELFVRRLPSRRNFLIAAGLEQMLEHIESLRFTEDDLRWLAGTGRYRPEFLEYLRGFRFTGDVHAMPEGTPFFSDEPIVRVVAPLPEAQLVESRLMNIVHFQTTIASKAVRSRLVAPRSLLVDFGMRRAHGDEAALLAARAAVLAGYNGTATVEAGERFGIPVFGTMAHSFVQAHSSEEEAFLHFSKVHIGPVTLLIDTYDTEAAAEKVARLAPTLIARGVDLQSVRLDSGDLAMHARKVREILDRHGLRRVHIFASGNLDEAEIQRLLAANAPIDGFGVGTRLTTSADAPYLDCAYKIQEYAGRAKRKRSEGKATWPGQKQVWRITGAGNRYLMDVVRLRTETGDGEPLLEPVMRGGRRLHAPVPLTQLRERCLAWVGRLPPELRKLETADPPYRVAISEPLRQLARRLDEER